MGPMNIETPCISKVICGHMYPMHIETPYTTPHKTNQLAHLDDVHLVFFGGGVT